jgi:hydroxymethylpyrimidine pyrophosphatase-like HAD family hydrolase
MKFKALATDYDGTIAHHGAVAENTTAALRRARDAGLKLLLCTGRRMHDLPAIYEHWNVFDRIIAENGAVLFNTITEQSTAIAAAPAKEFIDRLTAMKIPLEVGESVVATYEPHAEAMAKVISDLGLNWHIIMNKGSVMALPIGVTKASGFLAGLADLKIAVEESVAVGDAENDIPFIMAAGFGVAVANALPSVIAVAKWTTRSPQGAGVIELIDRLLSE